MKDTILYGDCRQTLDTLKSQITIGICDKPRMCVTSPPYYGLRDYGGESCQIGQEDTPEKAELAINSRLGTTISVQRVLTSVPSTVFTNVLK